MRRIIARAEGRGVDCSVWRNHFGLSDTLRS
jgi:hypothetical protein